MIGFPCEHKAVLKPQLIVNQFSDKLGLYIRPALNKIILRVSIWPVISSAIVLDIPRRTLK